MKKVIEAGLKYLSNNRGHASIETALALMLAEAEKYDSEREQLVKVIEDKFANVDAWKGIINAKIQNFSNDLSNHIDSKRHELQSIHQTIGELSVKGNDAWKKKAYDSYKDCLQIQITDPSSKDDSYMRGMSNGMIFIDSCIRGVEPKYIDKSASIPTTAEWRPFKEIYWFFDSRLRVFNCMNMLDSIDIERINSGNCFRTKEQAEKALERVKAAIRGNV